MSNNDPSMNIPENANAGCPGPNSTNAGKSSTCEGCPNQQNCSNGTTKPSDPDLPLISQRLQHIKHKILILSGKGGVGKSTIASQLAFALSEKGRDVGLLDIDICGPSIPKMLGLEGEEVHMSGGGWSPVYVNDNLGVMSIGFMLPNLDDAVIWRGPRKNGLIKQFLKDVDWNNGSTTDLLDYLIIDAPPGTSDEHISIAQYLKTAINDGVDGAVVVTTPQDVAVADVRKEISFCQKVGLPILGVIENMKDLKLNINYLQFLNGDQDCTQEVLNVLKEKFSNLDEVTVSGEIFDASLGGGVKLARKYGVEYLGSIPLDPKLCQASEKGQSILMYERSSHAASALEIIIDKILNAVSDSC